ncbi:MAG: radical SAM protein [Candidatus Aegiribacteria sp.]|nr:radical SAM protein [Candidatus Aegiribacteria sp.]
MRYTNYLLKARRADGNLSLMNTLWRSVISLNKEYEDLVNSLIDNKIDLDNLSDEKKKAINKIHEMGILTSMNPEEETSEVLTMLDEWRTRRSTFSITFAPTFACNFRCTYCIQKGNYVERPSSTTKTINDLKSFINYHLDNHPSIDSLYGGIFGGEPTLHWQGGLDFATMLIEICQERGFPKPRFQIVSNGYLLNEERFRSLLALNVHVFQVTVDGMDDVHNKRRLHVSGKDTFKTIIDNILTSARVGIEVHLLVVMDEDNENDLVPFIDYIGQLADQHPECNLRSMLDFGIAPVVPGSHNVHRNEELYVGKEERLYERALMAQVHARKLGFDTNDAFRVNVCSREAMSSIRCSPDGYLYKCFSTFGDRKYSAGKLGENPAKLESALIELSKPAPLMKQCLSCNILPLCRGGCQYMASQEHEGEYNHTNCEKDRYLLSYLQSSLAKGLFGRIYNTKEPLAVYV